MTTRLLAPSRTRTTWFVLLAANLFLLALASPAHADSATTLASVNAAGTDTGNDQSFSPVISADGTMLAFGSLASNLGPTDTNATQDIYLRDLTTGITTLASANAAGTDSGNGISFRPVFSADGTTLAFQSLANNLGPIDTNNFHDVYVRDLTTGTMTLVSSNAPGTDSANSQSFLPAISADGSTVAFLSNANNLGPTDTHASIDVYVRDLTTGTTTMASINAAGTDSGNGSSGPPAISADGTMLAFRSGASDLGPADTNFRQDVYVRDLTNGTTTMASVNAAGTDGGNHESFSPAISADGSTVAYQSLASNLGPTDTNGTYSVYVRDLTIGTTTMASVNAGGRDGSPNSDASPPVISTDGTTLAFHSLREDTGSHDVYVLDLTTGITTLVSVNAAGTGSGNSVSRSPVISADGTTVAFQSGASDLGPTDTNGSGSPWDVYVRDLTTGTTTLASVNGGGTDSGNGNSVGPVISADGATLAFWSFASNLGPTDTNGTGDIYVRDLGAARTLVQIDIKPGTFPNDIKPGSKGKMPVAILTTDSFNATTVAPGTVLFGATGTQTVPNKTSLQDVDADGDIDMVLQFEIKNTGIDCGDTSASFTGETLGGAAIKGSDSVKTVGCR